MADEQRVTRSLVAWLHGARVNGTSSLWVSSPSIIRHRHILRIDIRRRQRSAVNRPKAWGSHIKHGTWQTHTRVALGFDELLECASCAAQHRTSKGSRGQGLKGSSMQRGQRDQRGQRGRGTKELRVESSRGRGVEGPRCRRVMGRRCQGAVEQRGRGAEGPWGRRAEG